MRCWGLAGRADASATTQDGAAWCLVGNVVDAHEFGEGGETRRGSKHFRPGAKVYCLPPQWGDGFERVVAIGIARKPRRWITVVTRTDLITNWRAVRVYQPAVLTRLKEGWGGFNRRWTSRREVETAADRLRTRDGRGPAGDSRVASGGSP